MKNYCLTKDFFAANGSLTKRGGTMAFKEGTQPKSALPDESKEAAAFRQKIGIVVDKPMPLSEADTDDDSAINLDAKTLSDAAKKAK